MWAFAREFPRVHRRTRIDDVARRMVPISAMIGGALWIVNASPLSERMPFLTRAGFGLYWVILSILILSALVTLALRARDAKADESRRAALFIGGIVVGAGPVFLDGMIESLWAAAQQFGDEHRDAIVAIVFASILSIPLSTTYAVLSRRVLDIRVVLRASYRRLLTRRLLAVVGAAPLAGLGWLLASQPTRPVGDVMSEPLALLLVAAAGVALLAAGVRRRLLTYLDAWVDPESEEQRRVLAAASGTLAQATSIAQVDEVVVRAVRRAGAAPATLLVAAGVADEHAYHFTAPNAGMAPLARTSALVHLLESTREPLHVDPDDATSAFELLPDDDAQWVLAAAAAVVVPVVGPGSEINGAMVVGRRFDDRRVPVDLTFLAALAATVGLALDRLRLLQAPDGGAADPQSARECPCAGSWRRRTRGAAASAVWHTRRHRRRHFWPASSAWIGASAPAAWAWSIWRTMSASGATSRSRRYRRWRVTVWCGCRRRRARWRHWRTRPSRRSTASRPGAAARCSSSSCCPGARWRPPRSGTALGERGSRRRCHRG